MLRYRLIFGPIMIAALLGVFALDNRVDYVSIRGTVWETLLGGRNDLPGGVVMLLLFLVFIAMAARALCGILRATQVPAQTWMVAAAGILGCTLVYIVPFQLDSQTTVALLASLMIAIFFASLVRHSLAARRTEGAVVVASVTMFAVIYLGLLPGFFIAIRRWHSAWVVLAVIVITKSCDIGAYFTGRSIGRHKLIPWLSPGKTWEGLIGGVVLSAIVAAGLSAASNHFELGVKWDIATRAHVPMQVNLALAAVAGAIMALVGQAGDLTASLFKRDAGIKDSGRSIPGFGGVMDVIDSPIVVAPVAYWLLRLAYVMSE